MKSDRIVCVGAPFFAAGEACSGRVWCLLCLLAALATPALRAQPAADAMPPWPADAQIVSAETLRQLLAGRTFQARLTNSNGWRFQYQGDYLFVDLASGARDKGRWHTTDGRSCVTYEGRFPSGCSEMRAGPGGVVYLRRNSTGEIVTLRQE